MKIKYIRLKEKEDVSYYWLMLAYENVLRRTKKSRKRKELARKIIRICKGDAKHIFDISDDYRYEEAKRLFICFLGK